MKIPPPAKPGATVHLPEGLWFMVGGPRSGLVIEGRTYRPYDGSPIRGGQQFEIPSAAPKNAPAFRFSPFPVSAPPLRETSRADVTSHASTPVAIGAQGYAEEAVLWMDAGVSSSDGTLHQASTGKTWRLPAYQQVMLELGPLYDPSDFSVTHPDAADLTVKLRQA